MMEENENVNQSHEEEARKNVPYDKAVAAAKKRVIKKKRKKKVTLNANNIILVILCLALILLIIAAISKINSDKNNKDNNPGSSSTDNSQISTSEDVQIKYTEVKESMVYHNPDDIYWNHETKKGIIEFENPTDSPYNMVISIIEMGTGNELYKSIVLSPGEKITEFNAELPYTEVGEREVRLSVGSLDPQSGNKVNAVIYTKKLIIE